jgi:phosphinothricin acetyltransferase
MDAHIRRAGESDAAAITDLYNFYVLRTAITFDLEPHTVEQRRAWLAQFGGAGRHQCFIAEAGGEVIGYACSTQFRTKAAYDPTVEATIYLKESRHKCGIGTALYAALFDALQHEDVHRAVAGITQPNPASIALHEKLGFVECGRFAEVGRKFDRYWDVVWYVKDFDA